MKFNRPTQTSFSVVKINGKPSIDTNQEKAASVSDDFQNPQAVYDAVCAALTELEGVFQAMSDAKAAWSNGDEEAGREMYRLRGVIRDTLSAVVVNFR